MRNWSRPRAPSNRQARRSAPAIARSATMARRSETTRGRGSPSESSSSHRSFSSPGTGPPHSASVDGSANSASSRATSACRTSKSAPRRNWTRTQERARALAFEPEPLREYNPVEVECPTCNEGSEVSVALEARAVERNFAKLRMEKASGSELRLTESSVVPKSCAVKPGTACDAHAIESSASPEVRKIKMPELGGRLTKRDPLLEGSSHEIGRAREPGAIESDVDEPRPAERGAALEGRLLE